MEQDVARPVRVQSDYAAGKCRLAASRFADQGEAGPLPQLEGHPVDHRRRPRFGVVQRDKASYGEHNWPVDGLP